MTPTRPMLDCDAVMRQLWDYLDGELTEERMAAIREHLALCGRCYPQYDFEQAFLDTLVRARREHSDPEGVKRRVMTALQSEGFAAA
ncbi:MAG: zf-HC2 domain-containing protein [Gemmatimonadaceae bacterium]